MYQNAGRCIGFHLQFWKILVIIITTPKGGWMGTNTEKSPFLVSVHPSKSTETNYVKMFKAVSI